MVRFGAHMSITGGLSMVLETPKSADLHEDVMNLRVLR